VSVTGSGPRPLLLALCLATACVSAPVFAATPYTVIMAAAAKDPVTVQSLRGGLSVLQGSGGNITALAGPEGLVLVDCGIAVSQAKILAALKTIQPTPIRLVLITHWHFDHTDGDGWVRATGADVLASEQAVTRLGETIRVAEWDHTFKPVPAAALPNQVISGDKTLQLNGEKILIRHYMPSHTDGDLSVYFTKADVLATGDTFWNGQYPFIDYAAGGGIDGAIKAANANIAMAGKNTLIVPGHGPVGNVADQVAVRDMLVKVRGRVAALKAQGKTLAEVQAAKPTADFDAKWGQSVIDGALFTALVYRGV
jgi:glyoxylase-like metal-dependent hydrolase (beta-lactamase superfamily II)